MRILIVDDHEVVRRGVCSLLSTYPDLEVCGEAVDGQDAIEQSQKLKPDLILMDISMPGLNGIEATREIRRILPRINILILTQHSSPEMMQQAVNAGARGYVLKSEISENLITGIEKVYRGQLFLGAALPGKTTTLDFQEILQRSEAFEKALRESEERFRLTFEQAAVGMAHVAEDGYWLRVNQKLCEISGYTESELLQMRFQDITHPDDLTKAIEQARKVIKGELDQYSMEKRYIRKDRSLVWINLTVSAVRDAENKLKYFVSVIQDINERKNAEERLRESDERFRQTFEQAAVGIAHIAQDGRWLRVNQKLCQVLGYSTEELLNGTFQAITHPDDLAGILAKIEKVVKGELDQFSIEKRSICKDGSAVWVNLTLSVVRDRARHVKYFVAVIEDISERRDAEERLSVLLDYQTATMNNMAEGLYTLDENGLVTSVNAAAEAMFGWTATELLGKKMHDVTHYKHPDGSPFPASKCPGLIYVFQRGAELREHEDVFIRKDGSFMPVVFSASPLYRNGRVAGVVVSFRDDTEQRRVRTELRDSERRFREMIDALPVAVYTTDAEGHLTHFNRAAVEFSGRVPELGSDQWCVTWKLLQADGSPLPHDECPMATALKEGRIVSGMEIIVERPDGTRRWCTPYPRLLHDDNGKVVGGINMAVDITDRKLAEQSDRLLAAIVDSSDDAIVSKDLDGTIMSWNGGAERLFGYSAEEAVGQKITLIVPPDRQQEEAMILERLGQGVRLEHFETVRVRKDGTLLDVSLSISPLKNSFGQVIGASKIARDITEQKRAEQALAGIARQQRALFNLADQLHRAASIKDVCEAALDAILAALTCDRASVLLKDEYGVMRFVCWQGLSESYRKIAEGHSAWGTSETNPQPVCIEDIATSDLSDSLRVTIKTEGIAALAFIPLVSNGKLIGKFMTYFNAAHRFSEDEIDLSLTIARQLAFGIGRLRAEDSMRNSAEALAKLNGLSARLWSIQSLDRGLEEILSGVIKLLSADKGNVQILDEAKGVLKIAVHRGFSQKFLDFFREVSTDDDSGCGRALRLREPIVIEDVEADAPYAPYRSAARSAGYRAVISVPMFGTDGTPIGMLSAHFAEVHRPAAHELRILELYASQAANFLQRCGMEESLRQSEERFQSLAADLDSKVKVRTAELERRSADLLDQSEHIRDLSGLLLQAQDLERRRIARELHDSAGQILAGLGLNLSLVSIKCPVKNQEVVNALEDSQRLVKELSDEIRTMSYLLHPPMLDEWGLAEALQWYVQGLIERSTLEITLEIPPDFSRLPEATELAIFRVVQEALTNIHRHSGSNVATIRLQQDERHVTVEIEDRGRGISPERLADIQSDRSGLGIRGMRERVRQAQGEMKISSNRRGTVISATFPASEIPSAVESKTAPVF